MLRTMSILVAKVQAARNMALRITDVVDRTKINRSPNRSLDGQIICATDDLAVVATIPQLRIISKVR